MAALRVNAELAASDCTIVSTKMGQLTIAVKRAHSVWTLDTTAHCAQQQQGKKSNTKSKKGPLSLDTTATAPLLQWHCTVHSNSKANKDVLGCGYAVALSCIKLH